MPLAHYRVGLQKSKLVCNQAAAAAVPSYLRAVADEFWFLPIPAALLSQFLAPQVVRLDARRRIGRARVFLL
jgi:hypothetical protein